MAMYIMVLVMRVQEPCAVSDNKIGFLIHCIENIHYTTLTVDVHTETQSSHIVHILFKSG